MSTKVSKKINCCKRPNSCSDCRTERENTAHWIEKLEQEREFANDNLINEELELEVDHD